MVTGKLFVRCGIPDMFSGRILLDGSEIVSLVDSPCGFPMTGTIATLEPSTTKSNMLRLTTNSPLCGKLVLPTHRKESQLTSSVSRLKKSCCSGGL
jgi:hypothetical protein